MLLTSELASSSVSFPYFPLSRKLMPKRRLHPSKPWIWSVPIPWLVSGTHVVAGIWIAPIPWLVPGTHVVAGIYRCRDFSIVTASRRSIWRDWFDIQIKVRGNRVHLFPILGVTFQRKQSRMFPRLGFISVFSVLLVKRQ